MSTLEGAINSKVLVLNRHFLPVHVTSVRRAFSLLYQGIAKAVDDQYRTFDFQSWSELSVAVREESIGLINGAIRIPRVILLLTYDRVPKRQIRFNRHNVYARDRNQCQYCGKRLARPDLTLDHVVPRSQGGRSTWENIVCSCQYCNRRKGGRTPRQARDEADAGAPAADLDDRFSSMCSLAGATKIGNRFSRQLMPPIGRASSNRR